jgi:epoxyqueuosine reductase
MKVGLQNLPSGNRGGHMGETAFTEEIKTFGRELGLDLVGICSVDSLPNLERVDHTRNVATILPGAKSIIVGAIRMVDSAIESSVNNVRIAQYATMCLYQELNRVAYGLLKFLDDRGYRGAPVPSYLPIDMFQNYGLVADISLRHAAVEAGLGTMGMNRLLITESFGPRVRLMAILTDSSLVPDVRMEDDYCDDCGLCIERCPAGAISEEGVDIRSCSVKILKFGLPGLVKFSRKLVGADEEKLHEAIKSPEFAEFWQDLSTGIFYYCFECLNACPIGK